MADDDAAGDRVFWPSCGTLPECSCYVPANRLRRLAWWDFKVFKEALWSQKSRTSVWLSEYITQKIRFVNFLPNR